MEAQEIWRGGAGRIAAEDVTVGMMMRIWLRILVVAGVALSCGASGYAQETAPKCPPATRLDTAKDTYGTTVVADPYRWLEDQESSETRAWIAAEQKCTEAALGKLASRAAIAERVAGLSREAPGRHTA